MKDNSREYVIAEINDNDFPNLISIIKVQVMHDDSIREGVLVVETNNNELP